MSPRIFKEETDEKIMTQKPFTCPTSIQGEYVGLEHGNKHSSWQRTSKMFFNFGVSVDTPNIQIWSDI